MGLAIWLRSLGLQKYEAAFRANKINDRVLARGLAGPGKRAQRDTRAQSLNSPYSS
jgi:hypothetical protein